MFGRRNGFGRHTAEYHVMHRRFIVLALMAALASIYSCNSANAISLGYSRGISRGLERIQFLHADARPLRACAFPRPIS
jgi:hypothetical protein